MGEILQQWRRMISLTDDRDIIAMLQFSVALPKRSGHL